LPSSESLLARVREKKRKNRIFSNFFEFFFFFSHVQLKGTSLEQAEFEARTLCTLSHRNLVRGFAWWPVFDEETRPRIAQPIEVQIQLEACVGDLLAHIQALPALRLGRPDVLSVARQLLGALSFLHANDVVHRDIKLQNVLVADSTPQSFLVKLSDLSLANSIDECRVWPSAGTICTKAPEGVHPHLLPIGAKSDVYSLGVTLFCAATGQFPFCAHSVAKGDGHKCPSQCAEMVTSSDSENEGSTRVSHACVYGTIEDALAALEPPLALSAPLAALLTAMCQIDPDDRPSASECLQFEALHFRLRPQASMPNERANARGIKRRELAVDSDSHSGVVVVIDPNSKSTEETKKKARIGANDEKENENEQLVK
jgi:serine/threonine protein kinase